MPVDPGLEDELMAFRRWYDSKAPDGRYATPEQRMDWVEDGLALMAQNGLLQRERARRQREADELWAQEPSATRADPSSR